MVIAAPARFDNEVTSGCVAPKVMRDARTAD